MTHVRMTHIGGPTVLLEFGGWRILTDPTFDPPGRKYNFGWGTSSRKTAAPAIAVDDLGPIDAILLTHEHHADNLDDAGRALLPEADAVVTTVSGAKAIGDDARGLRAWDTMTLEHPDRASIDITATPCRHGPPGSHFIVGDVIGFALQWEGQSNGVLWFSGDTVLFDGVRQVANRFDVGTAVLHLGSVQFPITGPIRYSMTARDAVELICQQQPHAAVPVHFEGWSHFRQQRPGIEAELASAPSAVRDVIRWATIGQPLELDV